MTSICHNVWKRAKHVPSECFDCFHLKEQRNSQNQLQYRCEKKQYPHECEVWNGKTDIYMFNRFVEQERSKHYGINNGESAL